MSTKIKSQIGNLMNVTAGHIVHGCNAQGVMGSGVALAVKRKFPGAFTAYLAQHNQGGLKLGVAYPYHDNDELSIWNAITQDNFGYGLRQVSYDAVETCFAQINEFIHADQESVEGMDHPTEVHIPMIGAARGGGNWEIIREIIEQTMDYPVTLWLPDSTVNTL